jgi:hypothetical protein
MMEGFLPDPADIPRPPREVRFRAAEVSLYPDRSRVKVNFGMTPFLERPNIELVVLDSDQTEIASSSVVDNTETELSLTLHIRQEAPPGDYAVRLTLGYPDLQAVDVAEVGFSIPAEPGVRPNDESGS